MNEPDRSDELDRWITETAPRALAYASSLVSNRADAEDLVHDCYARLLAKEEEYDLPRDGSKLLFKAVSNACINWVQRRPPVQSLDACEHERGAGPPEIAGRRGEQPDQQAHRRELEEAIAAALLELPVTQRAVVELRSLGHSLIDVAEMLELSPANARVVLHRARQALAARLRRFLEEHVA